MNVTLSEQALTIATRAVESGFCASVDDAVERALELLAAETAFPETEPWTPEYAAEVNRMLEEAEEDVRAGRIVKADDAFWERMRERIREVGRASGNLG